MAEMDSPSKLEETRKGSVGAVEITDAHGRTRKIDVSELNEADLALAEQFGYHPVYKPFSYSSHLRSSSSDSNIIYLHFAMYRSSSGSLDIFQASVSRSQSGKAWICVWENGDVDVDCLVVSSRLSLLPFTIL